MVLARGAPELVFAVLFIGVLVDECELAIGSWTPAHVLLRVDHLLKRK
jgi:hypothetical protein